MSDSKTISYWRHVSKDILRPLFVFLFVFVTGLQLVNLTCSDADAADAVPPAEHKPDEPKPVEQKSKKETIKDPSPIVKAACLRATKDFCKKGCTGGEFRECYANTSKLKGPIDWQADCYAVRVGKTCEPCEQIFAVSGGGNFGEVSCEYFYSSIEKRNKDCDFCLKLLTDSKSAGSSVNEPSRYYDD